MKAKETNSKKDFEQALPELRSKAGKCKVCEKRHSYDRGLLFGTVKWPSTQLKSCPEYKKLGVEERAQKLENIKGCAICTSWLHQSDTCWAKSTSRGCSVKEDGSKCGKKHDSSLHGTKNK